MKRIHVWRSQFSWRMLLVRVLVNAMAMIATALLVPRIYFLDRSVGSLLLVAAVLGVLNAFVKPVIQFATLRFIFVTYGVVVALINGSILVLVGLILPRRFEVDGILWALVGGAVLGLFSSVLENLLGLTPPIVSDKYPEVRRDIGDRAAERRRRDLSERVAENDTSGTEPGAGA
jgi:putative membrane protein